MSLIQVQHLSFYYDGSYDYIFDDVSFSFDSSFKTALIGRNARGKTTFLKLLMKEYKYQGEITISEKCQYFPYQVKDIQQNTLDVCLKIEASIEQWQLERELNLLQVDLNVLYRPFHTLSQGEQTKVLLAILFLKENSFLLIDEPTNHLDQYSREIVAKYLRRQKGFLLVSHDRYFIDQCCDHIIAINKTTIDVVSGNFSSWQLDKQKKDQSEIERNQKLKKDIVKLEDSRRQSATWSDKVEKSKTGQRVSGLKPDRGHIGHMAAKMMKRSKNVENRKNKAISERKGLLRDIEEYDDLKIFPLLYHQSNLLYFSHFSLFYDQKILFKDLSFSIQNHDRIVLKGKNGCGKSSVISFILHQSIGYSGEYLIGSNLKISYVPQDCSMIQGYIDEFIREYNVDNTLVKTILRKLGFSRSHFEKRVEHLSEGQKKKVMLAISLATSAHLYIWDEPLNYIDVFSRIQIEKLIQDYKPTLLFVEHDVTFQQNIATRIIDFDELV